MKTEWEGKHDTFYVVKTEVLHDRMRYLKYMGFYRKSGYKETIRKRWGVIFEKDFGWYTDKVFMVCK